MKSFVAADDLYCGLLRVISRLGDVGILLPNTHHIVSGSQDRTIRIWSVSGEQKHVVGMVRIDSVTFSSD